jgi:lipoprotein-anchoring transpeptidase ErfK/SrfK
MRPLILACLALLALAAPVAAQEPAPTPAPEPVPEPEPRIAPGVRAGGVGVGGLTVAEAATRLQERLGARLRRPVVLTVAKRRFTLRPGAAKLQFNAQRTAQDALKAGADVPLRIRFSRAAVKTFVQRADRRVSKAPRNARVRFRLTRMVKHRSRNGRDLDNRKARRMIRDALLDHTRPRRVRPGMRKVAPRVRTRDLKRLYPTVVTIHRNGFRLRLFKRLRLVKSYGIAVGAVGYETPTGTYRIQNKAVNPVWNAPNRPWAGLYAGRSIPGGSAENPLKARWLGIVNGVGIHGTAAEYSIGSRASHGCIRMRVADVIDLYRRVPVGTPVYIR